MLRAHAKTACPLAHLHAMAVKGLQAHPWISATRAHVRAANAGLTWFP